LKVIDISIVGGLSSLIKKGYEQPPLGRSIDDGIVIGTGVLVIRMLLFVVIL
jgi:hypothetical protein